jgi:hypothetical protein
LSAGTTRGCGSLAGPLGKISNVMDNYLPAAKKMQDLA